MQMRIEAPQTKELPALRALWKEAFGDSDAYLDAFFGTAFSPDRCRCLMLDGRVAAALYWFDCLYRDERIAYLYAIATASSHRGKGFCRSLMEDTHRVLTERSYAGAILVPAEASLFGFYGRMGYRTATFVREFTAEAARETADAQDLALSRIDGEAYARLRRSLLPVGGLVQEGENLAFLETQATLYAGTDFLLAATEEDGALYGTEFLGAPAAVPQILRTLGYGEGTFRTYGGDKPLAMYLPLGGSELPPPSYLGIPLD